MRVVLCLINSNAHSRIYSQYDPAEVTKQEVNEALPCRGQDLVVPTTAAKTIPGAVFSVGATITIQKDTAWYISKSTAIHSSNMAAPKSTKMLEITKTL